MKVTISDPALKKEVFAILAGYEVNESGGNIHQGERGASSIRPGFESDRSGRGRGENIGRSEGRAAIEVSGRDETSERSEPPEVILEKDPADTLDLMRKRMTGDANLAIFSARPMLEEGEVVRALLDNSILRSHQLIYVGLRRAAKEEMRFLDEKNVRNYPMKEIAFTSRQEVCDAAMQVSRTKQELVLFVDLSVLDPAVYPGTTEPGGMTARELLYFLQRFRMLKNIMSVIITGFEKETPLPLLAKMIVELS